jgi:site-specific DNA-cytosine methylase
MIALSLCDRTGNMLAPWADAGYRCIAVDLQAQPNPLPRIEYIQCDVREYLPPRGEYKIAFAFPPCTHLAVSGARWWKGKGLKALAESIELVEACRRICEWTGAPYMIENPVGALSTHWRKPDYQFDPNEYGGYLDPPGDAYTKQTCLWTGHGFRMPPPPLGGAA